MFCQMGIQQALNGYALNAGKKTNTNFRFVGIVGKIGNEIDNFPRQGTSQLLLCEASLEEGD